MKQGRGGYDVRFGIGLVIANMIGTGVFLSAGFMAQTLNAGQIMISWVAGFIFALCGASAYAAIAAHNPRSGGEYRYLHDHLHPLIGYLSGWASLVVGFSASIAVAAFAAGAFLQKLFPELDAFWSGFILLLTLNLSLCFRQTLAENLQNILVLLKIVFVVSFISIGFSLGEFSIPAWSPPLATAGIPWREIVTNQYWIAFAFSGWNASIYVASQFRNPPRDVPRAMLLGCGFVGLLYLMINGIIVMNLPPEVSGKVILYDQDKVTLAHLVMENLAGPTTSILVSAAAVILFASSVCAMLLLGVQIYASMAEDKLLPAFLKQRVFYSFNGACITQMFITLLIYTSSSVLEAISSAAAVLMLFSSLTCATLFRKQFARVSWLVRLAAGIYILGSAVIIGVTGISLQGLLVTAVIVLCALVSYWNARR